MNKLKYIFLVPLSVAVCTYVGWTVYQDSLAHAKPTGKKDKNRQKLAVSVEVTRVQRRAIEDRIELVGSMEPIAQVEIRSRISGYIKKLTLDVGDTVKKGDVVVELDDSRHQESVSEATAALKVAEAQLKSSRAKQDLAEKRLKRFEQLARTGVATNQETEEAAAEVEISKTEVELQLARLAEAAAILGNSKLALEETKIYAQADGVVSKRWVEAGDLAKPDVPLLEIVDLSRARTNVNVVEKDYPKVQVDQVATLHCDAFPDKTFIGKVVRKAPVLDAETRTATVFIEIENPQSLLKPGMYARVSIVFSTRQKADVVPIAALIERDENSAIFVVTGDPPVSNLHEVETGIVDGESVEILSGISENDRVVTLGSRVIQPGQRVRPVEVDWSAANSENSRSAATGE